MTCSKTYRYAINPINQDSYLLLFANPDDFVNFFVRKTFLEEQAHNYVFGLHLFDKLYGED